GAARQSLFPGASSISTVCPGQGQSHGVRMGRRALADSLSRSSGELGGNSRPSSSSGGNARRGHGQESKAAHAQSGSPLAAGLSQDAAVEQARAGAVAPGNVRWRSPMTCVRGRQQKKWRRERLWKSRGVEKSNNDFPTPLGNPANPAGFPLSHSLDDYGTVTETRTLPWLPKGDTSNVVTRGTFLLSVDTPLKSALTSPVDEDTIALAPPQCPATCLPYTVAPPRR